MALSHRTNRLKVIGNPKVQKLQNGRFRLTYNLTPLNPRNDWYNDNKDRILADFGTLSTAEMNTDGINPRHKEAYPDLRLISAEAGNRSRVEGGEYIIEFIYETLTSTFVQIKDDDIDHEVDGLRKVQRTSVAIAGTDFQKTVGTTTISHQIDTESAKTLFLSAYKIDDTDFARTVTETYIEAGILSETTQPGRVPGTVEVTRRSVGTASQPSGELISFQDNNSSGYTTFTRSVVQGEITGVKQTYQDIVSVQTPGTVTLTTQSISQNGINGTVAVTNVQPIRTKKLSATVTVEVVTAPETAGQIAFDLSNVSCSVNSTNTSFSEGAGNSASVTDGDTTTTSIGSSRSFTVSSRIQNYPGHHFVNSSATGTISYTSAEKPRAVDNAIVTDTSTSSTVTRLNATGASAAGSSEGFFTTGVIQRRSRPILTTLSGTSNPTTTTFYEQITTSV